MVKRKKNSVQDEVPKKIPTLPTNIAGKKRRCKPEDIAKLYISRDEDQPGLEERFIDNRIGRGVFALQTFTKGEFLAVYSGKLLKGQAALDVEDSNYTFHFSFKGKPVCIDATEEPEKGPCLGRLVNHSSRDKANATMKQIDFNGQPRLCLYSQRDINPGEEIRYDYGVQNLPWEQYHNRPDRDGDVVAIENYEGQQKDSPTDEDENHKPSDSNGAVVANENDEEERQKDSPTDEDENHKPPDSNRAVVANENDEEERQKNNPTDEDENRKPPDSNGAVVANENDEEERQKDSPTDEDDNHKPPDSNGAVVANKNDEEERQKNNPTDENENHKHPDSNGAVVANENDEEERQKDSPTDEDGNLVEMENELVPRVVVISRNGDDGACFPLTAPLCLIGSSASCDIILHSSDMAVAAEHCQLVVKRNGRVHLKNLSSTYPVTVNNKIANGQISMQNNDIFTIASRSFRFEFPNKAIQRLPTQEESGSETSSGNESSSDEVDELEESGSEFVAGTTDGDDDDSDVSDIISLKVVQRTSSISESTSHEFSQPAAPIESHPNESITDASRNNSDNKSQQSESLTIASGNNSGNKVIVPETTAYMDGKRNVDKFHSCCFCGKLQLRIARHLQSVHKDEPQLQRLMSMSSKTEKNKELDKLRLNGDYQHNINVLKNNEGFLILARRPSATESVKYSAVDYLPCDFCLGFFLKNDLWRHRQTCNFAPLEKQSHSRVQQKSVLMLQSSISNNQDLHQGFRDNVISTLLVDDISLIIKNDWIVLKVGESLYLKHGKQQKQYISQEIRLLGRLVKSLRCVIQNENGYMEDFLKPVFFDSIIQAAQELSGVEATEDTCAFKTPSVALKCGPTLKKCCIILKGQALRQSDEVGEKNAERLLKLIEEEWKHKVTAVALRSIKETKRNTQVLLPTMPDLVKLKTFLDKEVNDAAENIRNNMTIENFQRLSSAVLCRVMMLNRRRSGETSKVLVNDYENRPSWQDGHNTEIIKSMPITEQKLVKRLDMIEIRGKRGRNVSLILTPDIKNAIDVLIRARPQVGINEKNSFLFPRGSGESHIQGHVCMREFASKAGLDHPERIGSTNMRKYIATVIQMMNLNDGELEWLSNHLGHSVNVHKEYYRNQESAIELGKVAKMLIAVDQGHCLAKVKKGEVDVAMYDADSESNDDEDEQDNSEVTKDADDGMDSELNNEPIARIKAKVCKRKWTGEEIQAIKRCMAKNYRLLVVPKKEECEQAISKEKVLEDRDWRSIKYKVYNDIQTLKKRLP